MSTVCPNGHDSTWPDWCSTCGERIDGAAPAATAAAPAAAAATPAVETPAPDAAASGPTCENCGVPRFEHDVFCESCGYDFASGSLPEGATETDAGESGDPAQQAAEATPMHAKISFAADFFAASVGDVELELPDPLPSEQVAPLNGVRILIGRKSTSRGIFPEIDVRALTEDPAVSSRHAMLERDPAGAWTLTDLGSTNGTFLTPDAEEPVAAGVAVPIAAGATFYVGAWTRIDLAETT